MKVANITATATSHGLTTRAGGVGSGVVDPDVVDAALGDATASVSIAP
jgi:hypothetical protein